MTRSSPCGLVAYVEALEARLGQLRGRELALSPRDFELARHWHDSGTPLGDVLDAIERARAQAGPVVSLTFCERFLQTKSTRSGGGNVGEAASCHRSASPASVAGAGVQTDPEGRGVAWIETLLEGLERGPAGELPGAREILVRAREMANGARLEELDREVDAWLEGQLTAVQLEAARVGGGRALERARQQLSPEALEQVLRERAVSQLRERLDLPGRLG